MNPWLGYLVILGSLAVLLIFAGQITRRLHLSSEMARKIVHIGMGIICSCFPWLFTDSWPVMLLAGTAIFSLLVVRRCPLLRSSIGSSLHDVDRYSLGELYFPIAVAIVWFISIAEPLYYSLSVLVLTLADALAALIGTKYGQKMYSTKEGYKTWEGSFSFFAVTFLCIHIPMLLLTGIGREESVLIAILIAVLIMIIEAVAWNGLDNLFIPLSVCIFLKVYDTYTAGQLLSRLGLLLVIVLFLFALRRWLKLDDSALLATSLFIFLVYKIGGWQWTIAPVVMFITYLSLELREIQREERVHDIYALLAVSAPGFFWLVLYSRFANGSFLYFYTVAYMAELICIYVAKWAFQYTNHSLTTITLVSAVLGFFSIMIPFLLLTDMLFSWKMVLLSLFVAILSSQVFCYSQPHIRNCPLTTSRWMRQGLVGIGASLTPMCFKLVLG